jgi:hypothetical protein
MILRFVVITSYRHSNGLHSGKNKKQIRKYAQHSKHKKKTLQCIEKRRYGIMGIKIYIYINRDQFNYTYRLCVCCKYKTKTKPEYVYVWKMSLNISCT